MGKHSIQRVKERYNLNLTYSDENNITSLIKKGNCIFLQQTGKAENQKFAYVEYKNLPLKVLYTRKNKGITIITTYPLDVDEYNQVKEEEFNSKIQHCIAFLKTNGYIVYKRKINNES